MTARKGVLLALIFLLTAVFACGMDSGRETGESSSELITLKKGKKAKEFTLKDMNGKDVSLADYKGKIVFLPFALPGTATGRFRCFSSNSRKYFRRSRSWKHFLCFLQFLCFFRECSCPQFRLTL